jgi:hypothetical protein
MTVERHPLFESFDERDILERDILSVDKDKLYDAFKIIQDKVSVDKHVILSRNTFKIFNEYVFGESNNIHHTELCDALETLEDVAGITPRNSGKSSLISTRYPAYRIGQDRGSRFILVSHTATLASSFGRSIENTMKMEKYILLFGEMIPSVSTSKWSDSVKWNETEKIVKDRPEFNRFGYRVDAKDATIFSVGVGGAVVGRRSDFLVLDDIIDRNDVKTDQQLLDIKYWYDEELKGTRHSKTQAIVVGSRWSDKDIYIDIISRMHSTGATITGNMVDEVLEQIRRFRELESELNS